MSRRLAKRWQTEWIRRALARRGVHGFDVASWVDGTLSLRENIAIVERALRIRIRAGRAVR